MEGWHEPARNHIIFSFRHPNFAQRRIHYQEYNTHRTIVTQQKDQRQQILSMIVFLFRSFRFFFFSVLAIRVHRTERLLAFFFLLLTALAFGGPLLIVIAAIANIDSRFSSGEGFLLLTTCLGPYLPAPRDSVLGLGLHLVVHVAQLL